MEGSPWGPGKIQSMAISFGGVLSVGSRRTVGAVGMGVGRFVGRFDGRVLGRPGGRGEGGGLATTQAPQVRAHQLSMKAGFRSHSSWDAQAPQFLSLSSHGGTGVGLAVGLGEG